MCPRRPGERPLPRRSKAWTAQPAGDEVLGQRGIEPAVVADAVHVDQYRAAESVLGPPLLAEKLESGRPAKGRFEVDHSSSLDIGGPGFKHSPWFPAPRPTPEIDLHDPQTRRGHGACARRGDGVRRPPADAGAVRQATDPGGPEQRGEPRDPEGGRSREQGDRRRAGRQPLLQRQVGRRGTLRQREVGRSSHRDRRRLQGRHRDPDRRVGPGAEGHGLDASVTRRSQAPHRSLRRRQGGGRGAGTSGQRRPGRRPMGSTPRRLQAEGYKKAGEQRVELVQL